MGQTQTKAPRIIAETSDGVRYIKVHFADENAQSGEAMWVGIIDGNDTDGIGFLCNHPFDKNNGSLGDIVNYTTSNPDRIPSGGATSYEERAEALMALVRKAGQ